MTDHLLFVKFCVDPKKYTYLLPVNMFSNVHTGIYMYIYVML